MSNQKRQQRVRLTADYDHDISSDVLEGESAAIQPYLVDMLEDGFKHRVRITIEKLSEISTEGEER